MKGLYMNDLSERFRSTAKPRNVPRDMNHVFLSVSAMFLLQL